MSLDLLTCVCLDGADVDSVQFKVNFLLLWQLYSKFVYAFETTLMQNESNIEKFSHLKKIILKWQFL